jgi:class 3 adenylate cyclase/Tfp pilus assembly protein PilF
MTNDSFRDEARARRADQRMAAERWAIIQDHLHEAIVRSPSDRVAYLDGACPDLAMRLEVDALVAAHERPGKLDALSREIMAPLTGRLRAATLSLPPTLSRYETLERLGGGGMGVVYRARDLRLDRIVALKFLPPHLSTDADAKARFLTEAQTAAALEHPNICTIHEVGETDDGQLYIAMPYYEGETLAHVIARGPLAPARAVQVALDLARALAKAHERGIVHRDLKPANVMLTTDGVVKLLDFGIAKLSDRRVTEPGVRLGTVAYMSPEQAFGQVVDHRTDIWSLGVVLYEMLTGTPPFAGDAAQATLYAILTAEPRSVASLRPDVPPPLDAAVQRALSKRPDGRYASMRDFARALASLAAGQADAAGTALVLPALSHTGERRQATILVTGIAGYGTLLERLSPDEAERVLRRIHDTAMDAVREHGGVINEFTGDEIVSLFGIPASHEDDFVRAVRAALDLHERVRELAAELEPRLGALLGVRSGVHTGALVAQRLREGARRYLVAGAPVQIATRLAALAEADAILVSPECQRLIAPFVETKAGAPVLVQADAPSMVPYRVVADSGLTTRLDAARRVGLTPYIGRATELGTLTQRLDLARGGEGQVAMVIGEAGAGKSRLLYELKTRVDRDAARVIEGRCVSYGATTPYLPFIQALRGVLRLGGQDQESVPVEELIERIHAIDPALHDFVPLYLHLLSIQSDAFPVPRHLQGEPLQAAMLEALVTIFTSHARRTPTLMLLEDWHWVDDASREVLRQLAEVVPAHPLFVVVSCRPEPGIGWDGGGAAADHQVSVHLGPLTPDATLAIMRSVLQAAHVPASLARRVHERTGGNPFFLEEICQAFLEEEIVTVANGDAVVTGAPDALHLPETVQAVIRTRVDRLDDGAREVLRVASVIGRDVERGVLAALVPDTIDLARAIERLKALGLIHQASFAPEPMYRFKHVLTQEVAYESLLDHQRRSLHGAVGRAIEERHPDRVDEHLELLAHHFSRAEEWEVAVRYARLAAHRASELSEFSDALSALERAQRWLAHLPDDAGRHATLADILLRQERLCETLGMRGRQQRIIDELIALLAPHGSSTMLAEAYQRQGDVYTLLKRFDAADRALATALRISREQGDTAGERNALRSIGLLRWHEGNNAAALEITENALAIDRERNDERAVAGDLPNLGIILKNMGEYERARQYLEEALALPVAIEDPVKCAYVLQNLANVHRALGNTDLALSYLHRGEEQTRHLKLPIQRSFHLTAIAHIYLEQGRIEESLEVYGEAVEMSRKARHADGLAQSLRMLGEALFGIGKHAEALPCVREAATLFAQLEDHRAEAEMWSRTAMIHEYIARADGATGGAPASDAVAWASACAAWETTLALRQRLGDVRGEVDALEGIARSIRARDGGEAAAPHYESALARAMVLDDRAREMALRNTIGILAWERGAYADALQHYDAALRLCRDLGDQVHEGLMLNSVGVTLSRLRRYEEARTALEEGALHNAMSGERLLEAHSLAALGEVSLAIGRLGEAMERTEAALAIRRELRDRRGEGWMLDQLARVRRAQGVDDEAAACRAAALEIARELGDDALMAATSTTMHRDHNPGGSDHAALHH